jgi:MoaA/NifB/PqqE/SkfB family radical SAM enzyme
VRNLILNRSKSPTLNPPMEKRNLLKLKAAKATSKRLVYLFSNSRRLWKKLAHLKARRALLNREDHRFNPMALLTRWLEPRRHQLLIRTGHNEVLACTEGEYNRLRLSNPGEWRTLCKAPWVSLDIRMDGNVSFCNHGGFIVGNATKDSLLDLWRGVRAREFRQTLGEFCVPSVDCAHCAHQVRIGQPQATFASMHFDRWRMPERERSEFYPRMLIFRMSNVCNLGCVMCNGETSSFIRKNVDRLPPIRPRYPDSLFEELRTFLHYADYVEFYGGEPFVVEEHLRIFDIMLQMQASDRPAIYVNTNGTILTKRIERYLEELPFFHIGVSLDGVSAETNARVRVGVKHEVQMRNLDYFRDYARRKGVKLSLNVTETRQNWFEIPDIFRLAGQLGTAVHINHCIFPEHCVLYTLPLPELKFVLDYLLAEKGRLGPAADFIMENAASYEFLLENLRQSYRRRADPDQHDGIVAALSQASKGYVRVEQGPRLAMPSPKWVLARGPEFTEMFLRAMPPAPFAQTWLTEFQSSRSADLAPGGGALTEEAAHGGER